MKCQRRGKQPCPYVEAAKYIVTATCMPAKDIGKPYGYFRVNVGANYIGKKFRVLILEERGE